MIFYSKYRSRIHFRVKDLILLLVVYFTNKIVNKPGLAGLRALGILPLLTSCTDWKRQHKPLLWEVRIGSHAPVARKPPGLWRREAIAELGWVTQGCPVS